MIETGASKNKKISGKAWIMADTKGSPTIERSNIDFELI